MHWIITFTLFLFFLALIHLCPIYQFFGLASRDTKMLDNRRKEIDNDIFYFFKKYNLSTKYLFGELYNPKKWMIFSFKKEEKDSHQYLKGILFLSNYLNHEQFHSFAATLDVRKLKKMKYDIHKLKHRLDIKEIIYRQADFRCRIFFAHLLTVFTLGSFLGCLNAIKDILAKCINFIDANSIDELIIFPLFILLLLFLPIFGTHAYHYFKLNVKARNLKDAMDIMEHILDTFLVDIDRRLEQIEDKSPTFKYKTQRNNPMT